MSGGVLICKTFRLESKAESAFLPHLYCKYLWVLSKRKGNNWLNWVGTESLKVWPGEVAQFKPNWKRGKGRDSWRRIQFKVKIYLIKLGPKVWPPEETCIHYSSSAAADSIVFRRNMSETRIHAEKWKKYKKIRASWGLKSGTSQIHFWWKYVTEAFVSWYWYCIVLFGIGGIDCMILYCMELHKSAFDGVMWQQPLFLNQFVSMTPS